MYIYIDICSEQANAVDSDYGCTGGSGIKEKMPAKGTQEEGLTHMLQLCRIPVVESAV